MTEYRIIKQHEHFYVQKKVLWWWKDVKEVLPSYGNAPELPFAVTARFAIIELARDFIESKRPKLHDTIEVVEHRIIR